MAEQLRLEEVLTEGAAVLDDEGFLDMPLDGLMDVCQEIGVYGREFGIEDTESLRKRRKYYREQSGRQIRI